MNINGSNMEEFLDSSKQFYIPVFQRNYAWDEGDCMQLINDLMAVDTSSLHHFFGSVCYINETNRYTIIDGQQRVTTTMLLLAAIRDCFNDFRITDLINDYLIKKIRDEHGNVTYKSKMTLNKTDRETFNKIVNPHHEKHLQFTDEEKETNLYKNYEYFQDFIMENIDSHLAITQGLKKFDIATISIQDENPQLIFESLNFAGKKLTNADLVRNYLLMPLDYDKQEDLYERYWHKIEEKLGDSVEDFLIDWLIIRNGSDAMMVKGKNAHINSNNLYYAIKREFPNISVNNNEVYAYFEDMYQYAEIYGDILSKTEGKLHDIINCLESYGSMPLLTYLIEQNIKKKIDNKQLEECFKYCISFIVRSKIVGNIGFNRQFSGLCIGKLKAKKEFTIEEFKKILISGNGKYAFPNDKEFKSSFINAPAYQKFKAKFCKYVLYSLEKDFHATELPPYSAGTVEHIIPQSISEDWENYIMEIDGSKDVLEYQHTFGNLALSGDNAALSNNLFEEKKHIYKNSSYHYTNSLCEYRDFGIESLKDRSDKLFKKMLKIYPNIEREILSEGVRYNASSDFRIFTGCKPQSYSFINGMKTVDTWANMFKDICHELYELDQETFKQMRKDNPKWGIFSGTGREFLLGDISIKVGWSTYDCLMFIQKMLKYYDEHLDLSLESDFWFEIKDEFNKNKPTRKSWIFIATPENIDNYLNDVFNEGEIFDWDVSSNKSFDLGDIVYIYRSHFNKQLVWKCEVVKIGQWADEINELDEPWNGFYVSLKPLFKYPEGCLSYEELKEHGLAHTYGYHMLKNETISFIESYVIN